LPVRFVNLCVITGLDPVIPQRQALCPPKRDGRVKPGHDRLNGMIGQQELLSIPGNPCPDGAITGTITTPDGATLRFARWPARGEPRGTVCVFTGRSEAIEKYFETVADLLGRSFAVVAMDWRGQGHSSRQLADPRKGHVASFADYELDLATFMQGVALHDCPPPYYALAHSMGGAVLLRAARAGNRWFERMVLVAPLIDMPRGRSAWLLRTLMKTLRRAGLGNSNVPGSNVDRSRARGFVGNPLTTDPVRYARNAALFERDPQLAVGSPTVAWLDATFDTIMEFRAADYPARIAQPVLLVAAGDDTIVSPQAIAAFAARLPKGQHRVVEGARHELLQEQDKFRTEFWAAFDAFVAGR
jgi:lysophospholipase